tara:strand:- start:157 stop:366 length:210 start_codon:yes stop_codon:yes gene_type:complete
MVNSPIYVALRKSYEADIAEAKAILSLYLESQTTVAEHTDFLSDLRSWTSKLSEAEENLETLDKHFGKG